METTVSLCELTKLIFTQHTKHAEKYVKKVVYKKKML